MSSALELLGTGSRKSSAIDLLGDGAKTSSALDLLKPQVEEPVVSPTTEVPSVTPEDFYTKEQLPGFAGYSGRFGFGPKPEGGFDEMGVPLNKEGKPYIEPQKATGVIAETLKGLSTLATHPMETIRGGLDFALSIPGFLTGLVSGAGLASKKLADQVIGEEDFNLEEIYNEASKGMLQGMEFFEPAKHMIVGEPTEESHLATQVIMAPLSAISALGHGAADYEGFKNYPNIRGAYRFLGDITGLMAMGLILHGPAKGEFAAEVEGIAKKGNEIIAKEKQIETIPNEIIQQAQKKVLEVEKVQLELRAKAAADKLGGDALIREELGRQTEGIARAKQLKPKSIIPEYLEDAKKARKKLKAKERREAKTGIELIEEPVEMRDIVPVKDIETDLGITYNGEQEAVKGPSLHLWTDKETNSTFATKDLNVEEVKSKLEDMRSKFDKVTEIDEQSGVEIPELKDDQSPFFQDKKTTNVYKKLYSERDKAVMADPELLTQKLINDVNRYYHGEEGIDIDTVRDSLSMLASRADELRMDYFISGVDHFQWKEVVSEAASWARGLERPKRGKGIKLNMMIPLDEVPKIVSDWLGKSKVLVGKYIQEFKDGKILTDNVYRNKELFDKTGFWLGKDGKWRYELDDSKIKYKADISKAVGNTLEYYIDYPDLFNAVPELKKVKLYARSLKGGTDGIYRGDQKYIAIDPSGKNIKETFFHELQHTVNEVAEAFEGSNVESQRSKIAADILKEIKDDSSITAGERYEISNLLAGLRSATTRKREAILNQLLNNPKLADKNIESLIDLDHASFQKYKEVPGEMEARLTEARLKMSAEERAKTPPWETLDKMLVREGTEHLYEQMEGGEFVGGVGTKLYSGLPLDEAAKGIKKLYNSAKKKADEARGIKDFKPKEAAKLVKEELVRSFLDRSGNIRWELLDKLGQIGYEIVQAMYLAKGSPSIAANMLKQMRKEVYGGLTRAEKKILDDLIFHARILDIAKYKTPKQFKELNKYTPEEAVAYTEAFSIMENMSPERAHELYHIREDGTVGGRAGAYFDWMKRPLKDMLDAELISQAEYNELIKHNYRRVKVVEIFDKKGRHPTKKGRSVYDSGIESLARGRDTTVFERNSQIMALEVFNRSYGRIMNNRANLELLKVARRDTTNPFVRIKEGKQDRIPSGWKRIFVYEKGERKPLHISPEMAKEWVMSDPETTYRLSQFLRYASGSPVLRTFATGINWGFALANLPRDVMHTWFASRVWEDGQWRSLHSPHLPVFLMRMAKDQATVFSDALLRKGRYEDYINEGGGMEFMVHQGRLFQRGRHLEGPMDKFFDFMGYFGETSEIMTRLAIRERAIKQGKSPKEATFAARDYMDFGQGGGIAKVLDNGMPYLNASIQGTRGLLRAFQPGSGTAMVSTYKLAQFTALVTGVYIAATKQNPKTMESVKNDIDSQNNLIIPLGDDFGFEDSRGQTRYPYLKIPLDPGQKFFKKFFEASTDKWLGNEIDVNGTVDSLKELSPVGVSSLPPTISGALGYVTNKDFWLNEDIWRKTDKPFGFPESKEEYIPGRTPQAYIDLGAKTGLSPERTKYVVEELVTGGTIWSYLAGQGYDAAFGDLPKDMKEKHLAETLDKVPVIRRFFGVTNPYSEYAGKIEDAKEKSDVERWIQNRGLDMRVEGYLYQKNVSRKEAIDYIKSFKDKDVYDRLKERFEFQEKTKDLPNRSFWLRLKGLTTEARAKVYVDRLNNSTPEEREQMNKEMATVIKAGGVVSKSFRDEVVKLRQEN